MPALRLSSASSSRRRRSSCLLHPLPIIKPGLYTTTSSSGTLTNRPIAFAPNVTPGTYVEPGSDEDMLSLPASISPSALDGSALLFPPGPSSGNTSGTGTTTTGRKRHPPGKRPSQGYIPRPPNAFMLFRADFVKQRHVPGSIETNHGSLSKIIGTCWRQLPLEEKHYWEQRAKEEKQQHKIKHPDYRFRPVHNKNKAKGSSTSTTSMGTSSLSTSRRAVSSSSSAHSRTPSSSMNLLRKDKPAASADEELRCESVAALLLEGKKGEELARAVRDLDRRRQEERDALEAEMEAEEREYEMQEQMEQASREQSPHPFFAMPSLSNAQSFGGGNAQFNAGLMMRRPSSVPLPTESWFANFANSSGFSNEIPNFGPTSGFTGDMAMPQSHFMPVSPSPIAGISFAAQQVQVQQANQSSLLSQPFNSGNNYAQGMMQRRPSSALASFSNIHTQMQMQNQLSHGHSEMVSLPPLSSLATDLAYPSNNMSNTMYSQQSAPRKSWTHHINPMAAMYNSYDTMPFLADLGLSNPYAKSKGSQPQSAEAEQETEGDTAGEPDYTLFNDGFSFASPPNPAKSLSTDVPPPSQAPFGLSIDPSVDWSTMRDAEDAGLASAITSTSASTTSTSAGGSPEHFAEYDMSSMHMSNLGMGEVDPLAPLHSQQQSYGGGYEMGYSQEVDPLSVMSGDYSMPLDMGMDMGIGGVELHAPKPERTPTRVAFGGEE